MIPVDFDVDRWTGSWNERGTALLDDTLKTLKSLRKGAEQVCSDEAENDAERPPLSGDDDGGTDLRLSLFCCLYGLFPLF